MLNGKCAESDPGHRYDRGGEIADRAEQIAVERAKRLFGADHAHMPPYRGTTAILAAYAALLRPGDTVARAGARRPHHPRVKVNFSGRWFPVVSYDRDLREQDRHALRDPSRARRGGNEGDRVSRRPGHPAAGCDNVDPRTGKGADRDASGISPSGIGRSMSFACHN
ncbi:hypothetical protein [Microbispora bryophytorum]|uniref:Serine hydroxymethyltransferase-like domain-containing protein n=1 Tax=Microbispora bryophytorum subsp. camponoti TaxID=1677852 RepID=A0ABR8L743_9ACTN|nr:hypothetical protein [Microbispora camponoti]